MHAHTHSKGVSALGLQTRFNPDSIHFDPVRTTHAQFLNQIESGFSRSTYGGRFNWIQSGFIVGVAMNVHTASVMAAVADRLRLL